MVDEYQRRVSRWVRANLERLRWTQRELSRRMGKNPEDYQPKISKSLREDRNWSPTEIEKLKKLFGNSPDTNQSQTMHFPVDKSTQTGGHISLGEIIASGFRDITAMQLGAQATDIPTIPLTQFAKLPQRADRVDDDSADQIAPCGYFVIVIDYGLSRNEPQDGDLVKVKRYHPIRFARGDLSQAENSIRKITKVGERFILKAQSTNPAYQDFPYDPDDKSVVIQDLIIGILHRPAYAI